MEGLETAILHDHGLPDPYSDEQQEEAAPPPPERER
jgi:hypothetical protein